MIALKVIYFITTFFYLIEVYSIVDFIWNFSYPIIILTVCLAVLGFVFSRNGLNIISHLTSGLNLFGLFRRSAPIAAYVALGEPLLAGASDVCQHALSAPITANTFATFVANTTEPLIITLFNGFGYILFMLLLYYTIKIIFRTALIIPKVIKKAKTIIMTSCITADNYAECLGNLDKYTKWKYRIQ
jgi:hypothetical protein